MDDDGLFGPGSMAWRLHGEPALLVGGLRALMLQALHPLAIAAVRDHSDYKSDVWGRFNRTSAYVSTTIFGDTAAALEQGAAVRRVHRRVYGVDSVTGLPYAADDPELLLWIHTTLVDSFLAAYRRYVGPLAPEDADTYVAEMVRQAELVGLAAADVPDTVAANTAFIDGCSAALQLTDTTREAMATFLHPPLPVYRRPWWWLTARAAIAILPETAVRLYRLRRLPVVDAAVRPLISQGSAWTKRHAEPPPVLKAARKRARAAGHPAP